MRFPLIGFLAFLGLSATPALLAHHSLSSEFDEGRATTIQGTITDVEWVNPHVYIHMDVKAGGGTANWALETLPPGVLRKGGLRKDMLGQGQTVTALVYLAREGKNLAFLRKLKFSDGHEVVLWVGDIKQAPVN